VQYTIFSQPETSASPEALMLLLLCKLPAHHWGQWRLLWQRHLLRCTQQQRCYAGAEAAQHSLEAAWAAAGLRVQHLPCAAMQAHLR
jgi:hypothetical protein